MRKCNSSGEENEKTQIDKPIKKTERGKPTDEGLIAEYQVLNESLERRRSNTLLVTSIMLPSSLLIIGFAITHRASLLGVLASILALIWVSVSGIFHHSRSKLDDIFWKRINDIEKELHIKGHKYVKEELKCKMWYTVRCCLWESFHLLLVILYFSIMVWLIVVR